MAAQQTSFYSEEYLQLLLERQITEQCELHGWSVLTIGNPVELIILEEEEDEQYAHLN